MPLVPTAEILGTALAGRHGACAFNLIGLEHAEALVRGATDAGRPVILQVSQNAVAYHGDLEPVGLAALALARRAPVPVALHLDHAESTGLVDQAVELGFGSVMFDASRLPFADNVAATGAVVATCHARGVLVEAELGEIGGKDGVHAPGARTDPGEAAGFVAATGVDALAVAVGSSHAMTTRDATLDTALIGRLRRAVPARVPLVLHGSSGVPDAALVDAVRAGITKVNIATHLNVRFTAALREHLRDHPGQVDPRRYLTPARDALAAETARLLALLGRVPAAA